MSNHLVDKVLLRPIEPGGDYCNNLDLLDFEPRGQEGSVEVTAYVARTPSGSKSWHRQVPTDFAANACRLLELAQWRTTIGRCSCHSRPTMSERRRWV
jgi:hypothetical protein